jgi:hypothetical protein
MKTKELGGYKRLLKPSIFKVISFCGFIALIFFLPLYPTHTTTIDHELSESTTLEPLYFVLAYDFEWTDVYHRETMLGWPDHAEWIHVADPIFLILYIPIFILMYPIACLSTEYIIYWNKNRKRAGIRQL